MGIGMALTLLFLGALAATDFFVALVPQLEKPMEAVRPYRGWIGLAFAVSGLLWLFWWIFGVWGVLGGWGLPGIGIKIRGILWGLTWLGVALLELLVGFLVGYDKIAELSGQGAKLEPYREKLLPYQRSLGILAAAFALWTLFAGFLLLPSASDFQGAIDKAFQDALKGVK